MTGPIWILGHLISQQIFLIAGRSVLVEREVRLSDVTLNPPDFEQERHAARASKRIMYRDTDQGVRYLVKQGDDAGRQRQADHVGTRLRARRRSSIRRSTFRCRSAA